MKVLVIGANGRVGSLLVTKLAAQHQVLAGSRNPDSSNNTANIEQFYMDLLSDVDTLAESMNGVDAIYFVSGSRGKNLLQIDLHGAIKTMQAAEKAGVKRYIMLSSVFALRPERWNESFLSDLADIILPSTMLIFILLLKPNSITRFYSPERLKKSKELEK